MIARIIIDVEKIELKSLLLAERVAGIAMIREPREKIDNLYPMTVSERSNSFRKRLKSKLNPVKDRFIINADNK